MKPRKQPQSIGCGKTFRGASALKSSAAVHSWLLELGKELEERVAEDREEHARLPRLLTVVSPGFGVAVCSFLRFSRSCIAMLLRCSKGEEYVAENIWEHSRLLTMAGSGINAGLCWLSLCMAAPFGVHVSYWSAAHAVEATETLRVIVRSLLTWMPDSAGHVGRGRSGDLGRQHLPLLPAAPPRGPNHGGRRPAAGEKPQSRRCGCCFVRRVYGLVRNPAPLIRA